MKKTVSFVSILLVAVMLFASCEVAPEAHEHSFAQEWSSDAGHHWHECTVEGCDEKDAKATHSFETKTDGEGKSQDVCSVCGYVSQASPEHEHTFEVRFNEDAKPEKVCTECGFVSDEEIVSPEHEHTFSDKADTNEKYHWYACTAEDCYEIDGKEEHSFGNPETEYTDGKLTLTHTCVNCDYKKQETHEVDSTVEDAVEWDNIFKGFKLTDFSLYVYHGTETVVDDDTNYCIATENAAYYCIPGSAEFYAFKNEDGSYGGYFKNQATDKFEKMTPEQAESSFIGATIEAVLEVSFEDNFDKFTYDAENATYTCDEIIEAMSYNFDGSQSMPLYCHTSEVKIVDGKINYISCEYSNGDPDGERMAFTYFNIGMSKVEIPQSVIDQANGVDK